MARTVVSPRSYYCEKHANGDPMPHNHPHSNVNEITVPTDSNKHNLTQQRTHPPNPPIPSFLTVLSTQNVKCIQFIPH